MVIKLVYKDKLFVETSNTETTGDTLATLSIDESNMVASLSFSNDANLIERRTAKRQANSILKTGFLLSDGKRVGKECKLQDPEEESIDDRLLQEGHKYR
ncbi:MAG: hypothetical protein HeimC3_12110 [Candidatus Heimdallarchaeota archaeon LC_3]|nr:MAG: hypothetical protein HeimC3_12110 [Candidatus Heimdallarchaeota archaeon LC_3]